VFTDLRFEVEESIEAPDGETIVSVQRTVGRMRHTQIPTDVLWAVVWTVRDGKALRAHGYLSKAEALEAAGLRE
jgi:ketosteroid isomerase-like protein